jgi:beta-N-acetylhexosaminidase
LSARVIERVIRGEIGFDGVLVSDDLAMGALEGAPGELAAAAVGAGSDLALHCSGRIEDSEAVLAAVPPVSEAGRRRLGRAAVLADRSRMQLERHALLRDQAALLEAFVAG